MKRKGVHGKDARWKKSGMRGRRRKRERMCEGKVEKEKCTNEMRRDGTTSEKRDT